MDWILGRVADQSHCGASFSNVRITDLDFANDAAILAESLEVLVLALGTFHEELKPLGLKVCWIKAKFQVLGDLLDEAIEYVLVSGEDVEVTS